MIYFETLSLFSLFCSFFNKSVRKSLKKKTARVYYIDASKAASLLIKPLRKLLGLEISRLDFEMRNIRDDRDELVRLRVHRQDLFDLQSDIVKSKTYLDLFDASWQQDRVEDYINKSLVDQGIMDPRSASRLLFLINVVNWHVKKLSYNDPILVISPRTWTDSYQRYAANFHVTLHEVPGLGCNPFTRTAFNSLVRNSPRLYGLLKSLKYRKSIDDKWNSKSKLFFEGRGDVNLKNDGYHSDFFWLLNSSFPAENLLYQYYDAQEKSQLEKFGINATSGSINVKKDINKRKRTKIKGRAHLRERREVRGFLNSYHATRNYWRAFFKDNSVKIYAMWHRFDSHHMAFADAIEDVGGISVYWPVSFDGYKAIECVSSTDVVFSYSHYSATLERQVKSKYKYNIITGYIKDHVGPLLREEAKQIREKMQKNGVEKIVFAIDENSIDDARWHTGHALQRENYSYILEKVLETPWLGVVFKPKASKTLRYRLGPVTVLLDKAIELGRCYIYEASGRHTTLAPPVLAGLSADICIHSHLCSGTAALECALEGLPTLLIDREGVPNSKLYELPEGKVIFRNWPDAIEAIMEYFSTPSGIDGFGDWAPIIDDLDPFRDGKAAQRMGDYLHWLIAGFEQGLDKDTVMENAANQYRKLWGEDKVITNNE